MHTLLAEAVSPNVDPEFIRGGAEFGEGKLEPPALPVPPSMAWMKA